MKKTYERINKEDGFVSPASEHQVRAGLEAAVKDVDLALTQIDGGAEIGNNFFTYRRRAAAPLSPKQKGGSES